MDARETTGESVVGVSRTTRPKKGGENEANTSTDEEEGGWNLRDLSCLLRCSLLLKALLQNWHLYFFSGAKADDADDDFLIAAVVGMTLATGMFYDVCVGCVCVVRARATSRC